MTKTSVGFASDLRRTCVGHIVGLLGVVFLSAGMAQAGPWEEFERRCLTPMENIEDVDVSELRFLRERDGPTILSGYLPPSEDFLFLVVRAFDGASLGCSVNLDEKVSQEAQNHFEQQFVDWSKRVLADEAYVLTEDTMGSTAPALGLHSNLTREPVLSVSLWKQVGTGAWVASVQETDLES